MLYSVGGNCVYVLFYDFNLVSYTCFAGILCYVARYQTWLKKIDDGGLLLHAKQK